MASLFPSFQMPSAFSTLVSEVKVGNQFLSAPKFSVETGDFLVDGGGSVLYGSGKEAWILWCLKCLATERYGYLSYPSHLGVEMIGAFSEPDRPSQESAIIRTITEALLADPKGRTVRVFDFSFSWLGEAVSLTFSILSSEGDTASLTAKL